MRPSAQSARKLMSRGYTLGARYQDASTPESSSSRACASAPRPHNAVTLEVWALLELAVTGNIIEREIIVAEIAVRGVIPELRLLRKRSVPAAQLIVRRDTDVNDQAAAGLRLQQSRRVG
ncbi:MAG: hypothetical protein NVSMB60_15910 [Mycobacterium sp.]